MSAPQKLTKKQRKGLAFRQRKGKGKAADEPFGGDVPIVDIEDPDAEELLDSSVDKAAIKLQLDVTRTVEKQIKADSERGPTKKRKPISNEEGAGKGESGGEAVERPKKRKRENAADGRDETEGDGGQDSKEQKPRYILFVGNLKYTTSKEAILAHFAVCDPPPQVRLLTPKGSASASAAARAKSKGCAFLEFSHRNALQQALKLHQSELESRRINVELTAGGGGKGEARLNKVKDRNRGLATQRTKRSQKEAGPGGNDTESAPERPQRHSTTSGIEEIPFNKRTWTVADEDDGETHRGGKKHQKKRGAKRQKDEGTGVNAIPVG